MTALFADVVGSTSLGERLAPQELKTLVGEFVTRMCEVVEGFGGRVTGFMGDGIAAFFGLARAREEDVLNAAYAALEIRSLAEQYAVEVRAAWNVQDFSVRVGLNAGRVGIGPVGASDPLTVAMGDAVNVAARLQGLAQPGRIVVGRPVVDVLGGRVVVRPLGRAVVKGRHETVEAFELVRAVAARAAPAGLLVGRAQELAVAEGFLDDLRAGRGRLLSIVGEGGVGKSRLMAEIHGRASGLTWLEGAFESAGKRRPHLPFAEALRGWLDLSPGATSVQTRVRLASALNDLLPGEGEIVAHLSRLLGTELDRRRGTPLEDLSENVRTRVHAAYARWLATLARRRPVVLALDNVHDAPAAAVELMRTLFDELEGSPVSLIMATRVAPASTGWLARLHALAEHPYRADEVRVGPLSLEESRELAEALSRGRLDDQAVRRLAERAEGNPLYLEEFLASALHGMASEAGELPPTLESMLVSRLDALPPEARRLAQEAAVLGRTFARGALESMSIVADADAVLRMLLRRGILREEGVDPAGLTFSHGLLRDAALSTLTPLARKRLEARAAGSLRSRLAPRRDRDGRAPSRARSEARKQRGVERERRVSSTTQTSWRDEEQ